MALMTRKSLIAISLLGGGALTLAGGFIGKASTTLSTETMIARRFGTA